MTNSDTQPAPPATTPKPKKDPIVVLHEKVGVKYNLGSIDKFRRAMLNPERRKKFWEAVGKEYNLREWETFDKRITTSYPKQIPLAQPTAAPVVPGSFAKAAAPKKDDFKVNQERELARSLGLDQKEGFWSSVGTQMSNFKENVIPSTVHSLKARHSPRTYDEFVTQQQEFQNAKDFPLKAEDFESGAAYQGKYGKLALVPYEEEMKATKQAFPKGGKQAYEMFKGLMEKKLTETVKGHGEAVAKHEKSTQENTKNLVQSHRDVKDTKSLLGYLGNVTGSAVSSSLATLATGGTAAYFLEEASTYEDALAKMMESTGKTREQIENTPEVKKSLQSSAMWAGGINTVLEKVGLGKVTKPVQKFMVEVMAKKVLSRSILNQSIDFVSGSVWEGATEGMQGAVSQYFTNTANGMSPMEAVQAIDWDKIIDDAIGGLGGGASLGTLGPAGRVAKRVIGGKPKTDVAAGPPEAPAPAAPPALTSGLVQGEPAVSEAPLATVKEDDGTTTQTFDSGLKDKDGNAITIETITNASGNTIHQALDGAILGDSREEVAQALVEAANPKPPAPSSGGMIPPGSVVDLPLGPTETKTEKVETKTPEGKETVTTTTSEKAGKKTSKKVETPTGTTTTTVKTPPPETPGTEKPESKPKGKGKTVTKEKAALKPKAEKKPKEEPKPKAEKKPKEPPAPKLETKPKAVEEVEVSAPSGGKKITPGAIHVAAIKAGLNFNDQEFKDASKKLTGKAHLDDMNEQELTQVQKMIELHKQKQEIAEGQKGAVQESKSKEVPVGKPPRNRKKVVGGVPGTKPEETTSKPAETTGQGGVQEKAKTIDYTNVPAIQQRAEKKHTGEGWKTTGKKNLKSKDGTKIFPIIEMKRGGETQYVNTKGDVFKNIADAVQKSEGRPEVKGKKKTPKPPVVKEEVKKEETKKEEKKPEAKKEEPAKQEAKKKEEKPKEEKKKSSATLSQYTTQELGDLLRNASPKDRQQNRELFDDIVAEIAQRKERKAGKQVQRSKEKREGTQKPAKKPITNAEYMEVIKKANALRDKADALPMDSPKRWALKDEAEKMQQKAEERIFEEEKQEKQEEKQPEKQEAKKEEKQEEKPREEGSQIRVHESPSEGIVYSVIVDGKERFMSRMTGMNGQSGWEEMESKDGGKTWGIIPHAAYPYMAGDTKKEAMEQMKKDDAEGVVWKDNKKVKKEDAAKAQAEKEKADAEAAQRKKDWEQQRQEKRERREKEEAEAKKKEEEAKKQEEKREEKKEEAKKEEKPPVEKKPEQKEKTVAKEPVPVSPESQDILDFLSRDIFPETIADFIEALQDISGYSGKMGTAKAMARLEQMKNEGLIQVKGKKIFPTFEKQGNEYAPQTMEEYTPKKPETIVSASRRAGSPIGLIGGFGGNVMPKWLKDINIKKSLKKAFTNQGVIPRMVFDAWNKTQVDLRTYEARAMATAKKLMEQVHKDYKGKITDLQVATLNLALQGKTTTPDGDPIILSPKLSRLINDMRLQIDNLTRRFVRDGIVEGQQAAEFMANLGLYLHRSYEKFDNPDWQAGEDAVNRAMDFLRQKYPTYDDIQMKALMEYLMHSPEAPMAVLRGGTYGGMDLTVLKKRKGDDVLAPEIRALMGEYNDPVTNFTRAIAKMAQVVAKNKFQQDVVKEGFAAPRKPGESHQDWFNQQVNDGKFLFPDRVGEFNTEIKATGVPSPFVGKFATPEVAEMLSRHGQTLSKEGRFMRWWLKAVSGTNFGLTVLNPGTHARNFMANPFFALANGHVFNPTSPIDAKEMTESEIQEMERKRAKFAKEEKKLMNLRITAMEDLARETNLQAQINQGKVDLATREARQTRAEASLAKAKAANADVKTMAERQARVDIAKRRAQAKARAIKRDQDLLNGVFDATKLTEARDKVRDLIAKGAARADIDKAREKLDELTTREANVQTFRDANQRKIDIALLEDQVEDMRETVSETDPFTSLLTPTKWAKNMEKWRAHNLIDDNVAGGLLKDFWRTLKKDPLMNQGLFSEGALSAKAKLAGKAKRGVSKLYQAGDWVWKVRAFEIEAARYKKAYPNLSEQEVELMAAENVKNTYPTFSRVMPIVKAMKKVPVIGAFLPFPAEVVRTHVNTITLAWKEIRSGNPELRKIGMGRMVGTLAALSLPTAMSLATRALLGMDDQDEEDMRTLLPQWSRNSTILFLDKKGMTDPILTTQYRYIDFGAFDPYAVLKKPWTALLFRSEPIEERVIDALLQATEPITNPHLFTEKSIDLWRNQDARGRKIVKDTDMLGTRIGKRVAYMTEALSPGFVKAGTKIKRAFDSVSTEHGKQYTVQDELLALAGFRTTTLDVTITAERYITSAANKMLLEVKLERTKMLSQDLTEEEYYAALREYIRANQRGLELVWRQYQAVYRLGADPGVMGRVAWPSDMAQFWDYKPPKDTTSFFP